MSHWLDEYTNYLEGQGLSLDRVKAGCSGAREAMGEIPDDRITCNDEAAGDIVSLCPKCRSRWMSANTIEAYGFHWSIIILFECDRCGASWSKILDFFRMEIL